MKHSAYLRTAGFFICGALAQVDVPPNFTVGVPWQIIIQNTLDVTRPLQPTNVTVWDLDLYHIARNPNTVEYLRTNNPGTILVCYFNAGLAQDTDCDYDTKWRNSGLLGNIYDPEEPEFNNERWVNIKNQTARDWMKQRITLANQLGCDGVDPDNIDGYLRDADGNNGTWWDLSQDDYVSFVTELATHAHSLTTSQSHTMLIGQKNARELVGRLSGVLDFAVLEDCKRLREPGEPAFCRDFQAYIATEKPVFSIEYPSTLGDPETGACNARGVDDTEYHNSCDTIQDTAGFSPVLKIQGGDGELNNCTQYCTGMVPGTGVVVTATNPELDGIDCPPGATEY
ncbi:glycoside hydrolase superfamily [Achaetomium macrosporum]|uniref:alpha-galactosidase n=1 Tax=Achaetomium macrosporum TaxID=79813 RepID=A0AAN7C2S9_9PEZI|nr:glycoside hydrolase superfamily [Achaetomium macrosporum]